MRQRERAARRGARQRLHLDPALDRLCDGDGAARRQRRHILGQENLVGIRAGERDDHANTGPGACGCARAEAHRGRGDGGQRHQCRLHLRRGGVERQRRRGLAAMRQRKRAARRRARQRLHLMRTLEGLCNGNGLKCRFGAADLGERV